MAILDISNVSKSFGGVKANVDISMSVEQGSIVGLIGPNGSGKTTLFNSIVGTIQLMGVQLNLTTEKYLSYQYLLSLNLDYLELFNKPEFMEN